MKGKDYKGFKKNEDSKLVLSESKSAKKIGLRCDSVFCKKNVIKRKCFTIQQLFKTFWDEMTWCERKSYVAALCKVNPTKINKTGTNSSMRADTISYFLKIKNKKLQVCKKMFYKHYV